MFGRSRDHWHRCQLSETRTTRRHRDRLRKRYHQRQHGWCQPWYGKFLL